MGRLFERELNAYAELGYDTLPLAPRTKKPIRRDWPERDPRELWRDAPDDANIGIRCGGKLRLAVLDADDDAQPQTSANLQRYLAGLGIGAGDCPVVATPSGGRHFYLTLLEELPGHARLYRDDLGAGELRYGPAAQAVAPPSVVSQRAYRLIAGDWGRLARVDARALLPILKHSDNAPCLPPDTARTPRERPPIPPQALALLQGQGIEHYRSRSHAEAAIVRMLVGANLTFDEIVALFTSYLAAGKFAARSARDPDQAIDHYLYPTFLSAQRQVQAARASADAAIAWACHRVWTGRTGAVDRAVFLAHCAIAQRAGRIQYHADCRTLAELAHVSSMTAARANHRLVQAGLLTLVSHANASLSLANVFHVQTDTLSLPVGSVSVCPLNHHDVFRTSGFGKTFRARGLGKSAELVFGQLSEGQALSIIELAQRTGRSSKTVRRALKRMARIVEKETGEVLTMVAEDEGRWRACESVDLDRIAQALGTLGKSEWQKRKHAYERAEYRRVKGEPTDSQRIKNG